MIRETFESVFSLISETGQMMRDAVAQIRELWHETGAAFKPLISSWNKLVRLRRSKVRQVNRTTMICILVIAPLFDLATTWMVLGSMRPYHAQTAMLTYAWVVWLDRACDWVFGFTLAISISTALVFAVKQITIIIRWRWPLLGLAFSLGSAIAAVLFDYMYLFCEFGGRFIPYEAMSSYSFFIGPVTFIMNLYISFVVVLESLVDNLYVGRAFLHRLTVTPINSSDSDIKKWSENEEESLYAALKQAVHVGRAKNRHHDSSDGDGEEYGNEIPKDVAPFFADHLPSQKSGSKKKPANKSKRRARVH